jgi:hypothetical protein
MQKFLNQLQTFAMVIWFCTAIYLSLNFIFSYFIETNPYISKTIFTGSFLILTIFFVKEKIKNLPKIIEDSKKTIKFGCRSCKKK